MDQQQSQLEAVKGNITIKCFNCGFTSIPENFNGFQSFRINDHVTGGTGYLRQISIECPICEAQVPFQHFDLTGETTSTYSGIKLTYSHLLVPHKVDGQPMKDIKVYMSKTLKDLRLQYLSKAVE